MSKLTLQGYLDAVLKSKLVEKSKLAEVVSDFRKTVRATPDDYVPFAKLLIATKLITPWQNSKLSEGKSKGFFIGKYKLLAHIGTGGMSSVYLAEHTVMRRRVALKVLPSHLVEDESYLRRFYKESQATAALDHPNIVRAYDVDNEGKIHYLVMEFVDGSDLEVLVKKNGALPYDKCAEYIRQAAEGLAHAHERRMIHRDIKPANLLVDNGGTVKILDMGLAHLEEDGQSQLGKGNVMGTTDFLAPEQAMGSTDLDSRADIYSLGCTLYYVLTGVPPFAGNSLAEVLLKHQTQDPKPVSAHRHDSPCPRVLESIYRKMMAKDPANRYQNCTEVAKALSDWLAQADDHWSATQSGKRTQNEAEELSDFLSQLNQDHEQKTSPPAQKKEMFLEAEEADEGPSDAEDEMQTFFSSLGGASADSRKSAEDSTEMFLFGAQQKPASSQPPARPPGSKPPVVNKPANSDSPSKVETRVPSQSTTPTPSKKADNMEFICPNGHRLFGPTKLQGRRGQCPHCKAYFRIPFLEQSAHPGEPGRPGSGSRPSRPSGSPSGSVGGSGADQVTDFLSNLGGPSASEPSSPSSSGSGDESLDQFFSNLERD